MIGGSYDFKVVKLFANYVKEHEESAKPTTTYAVAVDPKKGVVSTTTYGAQDVKKTYSVVGCFGPGGSAAGAVQFEYAKYKTDVAQTTAKGFSLGYTHALSKRTTLYTAVARISNDDATGANVVRAAKTGSDGENITGSPLASTTSSIWLTSGSQRKTALGARFFRTIAVEMRAERKCRGRGSGDGVSTLSAGSGCRGG